MIEIDYIGILYLVLLLDGLIGFESFMTEFP